MTGSDLTDQIRRDVPDSQVFLNFSVPPCLRASVPPW